jgi:hypothetical protein
MSQPSQHEIKLTVGRTASAVYYRVSTMKHPDLGDVLEKGFFFSSGVKGLLHTTGVHIPA